MNNKKQLLSILSILMIGSFFIGTTFAVPATVQVYDMSNNRVIGTVYHNTTGKTVTITVIVTLDITKKGDQAEELLYVDSNSNPQMLVADAVVTNGDNTVNIELDSAQTITFNVPPNYYYKLVNNDMGTGQSTIGSWFETY